MAVPGVAEQLECQQRTHGVVRGDLRGPGEVRLVKEVLERDLGEERQKEEKPAELGAQPPGFDALLTASKKWTFELPMQRTASWRHVFEANVDRFAMILQVHGAKPINNFAQQASIR